MMKVFKDILNVDTFNIRDERRLGQNFYGEKFLTIMIAQQYGTKYAN